MKEQIYLDYNSTAPARPEVAEAVSALLKEPSNASSVHGFGRRARMRVEKARDQIAALAGCKNTQVIFNSGATEGNNTVLKSFTGQRVLVSAIEHPAVLDAASEAERIPVTRDGVIDLNALEVMLEQTPAPALVSVMFVNNETGVIQPVEEISKRVHAAGAQFHVDAVQAAGRTPIEMNRRGIDFLTLSAHKTGGPQGVGALIVGPCAQAPVLLHGGGQEKRARAGTENVAGIAGFGVAVELALADMDKYQKLAALRDSMEARLKDIAPEAVIFGQGAPRAANTFLIALPGIPSKTQLMHMDLEGIAVSNGSACSSGKVHASHVTRAMGYDENAANSALRVSMGWNTKDGDIEAFVAAWGKMRARMHDKLAVSG